jgi:hypothetical protein
LKAVFCAVKLVACACKLNSTHSKLSSSVKAVLIVGGSKLFLTQLLFKICACARPARRESVATIIRACAARYQGVALHQQAQVLVCLFHAAVGCLIQLPGAFSAEPSGFFQTLFGGGLRGLLQLLALIGLVFPCVCADGWSVCFCLPACLSPSGGRVCDDLSLADETSPES